MKANIALLLFLLCSFTARAQNNNIVALVYHRFGDSRFPSTNISLPTFEEHLKYLKALGFESLTFSAALDDISSSNKNSKKVVITIDDGYKSFFKNGLPLLKKYGFTATLFINTSTVGSSDYMNWDELKQAQEAGIEIGNHSHSHPFFLNEPEGTRASLFKKEVMEAQHLIQSHLDIAPTTFAYPYGEWDDHMKVALAEMGFKGAAAQNSGIINSTTDPFQCPRFPMSETYGTLNQFKEKVNMLGLSIIKLEVVSSGFNGSPSIPRINIQFEGKGLKLENTQCFVQGAECSKSMQIERDEVVKLALRPKQPLKNRRTLFTITVPDMNGKWHWYSYVWVMPEYN